MPSIYSEAYAVPVHHQQHPAGTPHDGTRRCVTPLPLPPAPPPPPKRFQLPARWEEHQTEAGEAYYYDTQSGQSRWTRPDPEPMEAGGMSAPSGLVTRSV